MDTAQLRIGHRGRFGQSHAWQALGHALAQQPVLGHRESVPLGQHGLESIAVEGLHPASIAMFAAAH